MKEIFKCYQKPLRLLDCYRTERTYKIEVHQSISSSPIFDVLTYLKKELKQITVLE